MWFVPASGSVQVTHRRTVYGRVMPLSGLVVTVDTAGRATVAGLATTSITTASRPSCWGGVVAV